ncbi:MAG: hypothetical protein JRI79_09505 [Deltaproteobacteria bacterium]|nr:hypothetical protein [Deltaproteobacteria bacterium]MBW1935381.1 hypothetical protein [Deltaproteobacteria bacterium]MBW1978184.1 hypothetical protein [Deltaproteobacteria bacterium]MBW2045748.1 hypothetical protein [Deltaproteobacteria bacterium]MBW2301165.1 hypothetical protein [Deltaproteobacteria bacterium]
MISYILVYGLVNSVTLALIAIGFSLTFGISGVANFAYGAFYLLSGYLTWMLLNYLGLPLPLAIVITVAALALVGFLTYWLILLRVRGIAQNEHTAISLGIESDWTAAGNLHSCAPF